MKHKGPHHTACPIATASADPTSGSLFAASIEVRHDCPVGNLSREFPDLHVFQWPMNRGDVFQATGSDIFAGLPDKQPSALLLGIRHGYYSLPSS